MTTLADVIRPGTTRGLDFLILEELRKRTGISPRQVLKFALSEVLCNSLDKDATKIHIGIESGDLYDELTVNDNGTRKVTIDDLKLILDFDNKGSSKRGFLRVSRGYLGNALKSIFGFSHALAEAENLPPKPISIQSGTQVYTVSLKPDKIQQRIGSEIQVCERQDDGLTHFTVTFPKVDKEYRKAQADFFLRGLMDVVSAAAMVNPTRLITFNISDSSLPFTKNLSFGSLEEAQTIRQETSALWYTQKQFTALFEDFVRATPETRIADFISLFRGFTGKKVIREILQKLSANNRDLQMNGSVQFLPSTSIKDMTEDTIPRLLEALKDKSKPVTKRSIPAVLGAVGKESFEKLRVQSGWTQLRYIVIPSMRRECPLSFYAHPDNCKNIDHVEYPFLVEIAVFDRACDDQEGLKIYQCVNFMASIEDIFSRIYDIKYHLGRVGINKDSPVTVVAHLVCPVLKWLNYGKSGLDE